MKLAASNICWPADDFEGFLEVMAAEGAEGVELAPSRLWPEPLDGRGGDVQQVVRQLERHGLECAGFHSLLFNRPDLCFFGENGSLDRTVDYIIGLGKLCADMGGRTLVLGSPRNRNLAEGDVVMQRRNFVAGLQRLSRAWDGSGLCLCLEYLTPDQTNFIVSAEEQDAVIRSANVQGVAYHLDTGVLIENKEEIVRVLSGMLAMPEHCHVNDPGLRPPGSDPSIHQAIGRALRQVGYSGFVSIEMREPDEGTAAKPCLREALRFVRRYYCE